jgi:hypothetical protein
LRLSCGKTLRDRHEEESMPLTQQQATRIQEIEKREAEIRSNAQAAFEVKIISLMGSAASLLVPGTEVPAVVAGIANMAAIKSWELEMQGFIKELDQLDQEKAGILSQANQPSVITTDPVIIVVPSANSPDGQSTPTIVDTPGDVPAGTPAFTIPPVVISADPSGTPSSTPTITISPVVIEGNSATGTGTITLPEVTIDGQHDSTGGGGGSGSDSAGGGGGSGSDDVGGDGDSSSGSDSSTQGGDSSGGSADGGGDDSSGGSASDGSSGGGDSSGSGGGSSSAGGISGDGGGGDSSSGSGGGDGGDSGGGFGGGGEGGGGEGGEGGGGDGAGGDVFIPGLPHKPLPE